MFLCGLRTPKVVAPRVCVQYLPPEILFRIFTMLPARDMVVSMSRVCCFWKALSRDEYLWKYYCLQSWGYLRRTQELLASHSGSWLTFYKSNFDKKNLSFLVIGAEGGGEKDERLEDVRTKLKSTGLVNVDVINARIASPTAEQLRAYNGVLFFSYHGFNQTALGTLLADYVDAGGGVVVGTYSSCGRGNRLEGRWLEGYEPIALGATSRAAGLSLGVHDKRHPVMRGVTSFFGGGQSSHGDGQVQSGASVVAAWTNGRPLVVELRRHAGVVVALNFYPPSADAADGCWDPSTHGATLLANALYHVTFSNRL